MMAPHVALAARLVGRPYRRGATGPDAFDCWGLVRTVSQARHGVDLAPLEVAAATSQAGALRAAIRAGGWCPVPGAGVAHAARDGDLLQLRNAGNGLMHIGMVVDVAPADRRLLHAEGSATDPTPGVICEPLGDALWRYLRPRLWRRATGGCA